MRLEQKDIQTLLPFGITLLSKKGNLNVKNIRYLLEEGTLTFQAELLYANLPVKIDGCLKAFTRQGAIAIQLVEGHIDSLLMKGDLLTFIKPMLKGNKNCCIEDDILYFYHSKLQVSSLVITPMGIELTFK